MNASQLEACLMTMESMKSSNLGRIIEPIFTHSATDPNVSAALGEFLAAHPGLPSFSNVIEKLQGGGYGSVSEFRDEVLMITGTWQDFFEQAHQQGKMLCNTIAVMAEEKFKKRFRKLVEKDEYEREKAEKVKRNYVKLMTHPMLKDFRLRMDGESEHSKSHNIDSKIDPGPWPQ